VLLGLDWLLWVVVRLLIVLELLRVLSELVALLKLLNELCELVEELELPEDWLLRLVLVELLELLLLELLLLELELLLLELELRLVLVELLELLLLRLVLVELLELLLLELLLLELELLLLLELLELDRSSWPPSTIMATWTSPPTAPSRIVWLRPSTTSKAVIPGWAIINTPPFFRAPPLATVSDGAQVKYSLGWLGISSVRPAPPVCQMARNVTSSIANGWPTASWPTPAPKSRAPRSYKSKSSVVPLEIVRSVR